MEEAKNQCLDAHCACWNDYPLTEELDLILQFIVQEKMYFLNKINWLLELIYREKQKIYLRLVTMTIARDSYTIVRSIYV